MHGGVIWAIDGLQPEGHDSWLYVLYEVLSTTPVAAIQLSQATAAQLETWLAPYQALPFSVLATLSDGEKVIEAALKGCWPEAPHQRCQAHFLNNVATPVLALDTQLRQGLRDELGGLPPVPKPADRPEGGSPEGRGETSAASAAATVSSPAVGAAGSPPFCPRLTPRAITR